MVNNKKRDSLPDKLSHKSNTRTQKKRTKKRTSQSCAWKRDKMPRSLQQLQEYHGKSDNVKELGKGVFEAPAKGKRTRQPAPSLRKDNRDLMFKGTRVAIYWFEDNVWYSGTVRETNFNHESLVQFDDGTQDWFNLCMEGPRVRAI